MIVIEHEKNRVNAYLIFQPVDMYQ